MAKTLKRNAAVIFFVLLCIAAVFAEVGCDSAKSEAQAEFKEASAVLEEKNAELDSAVSDLMDVISSDAKPLDEATVLSAEEAISAAQGAKVTPPDIASDTDEIMKQINELAEVDYKIQLESLAKAKADLQNSIKQRELVTNPDESFVIQRLSGVEHIDAPTAVTEDNDPNGQLNKQGGYTATVYFLSDYVNQNDVLGDSVIDKGTDGGGAVEVFPNEKDAEKRNTYLSAFDGGGIVSPGSHTVCGTCVIRTSDKLTASQQKELEAAIIEALTNLE